MVSKLTTVKGHILTFTFPRFCRNPTSIYHRLWVGDYLSVWTHECAEVSITSSSPSLMRKAHNIFNRKIFHPDYDNSELPAHVYLRSVHNISIERSWLRLRLDWGDNAVAAFRQGEERGLYNPSDPDE